MRVKILRYTSNRKELVAAALRGRARRSRNTEPATGALDKKRSIVFQGRTGGIAAKRVLALFLAALFAVSLSLAGCSSPDSTAPDNATDAPVAAAANDTAAADSADAGQSMAVTVVVLDPADSGATAQEAPVTVSEGATVLDALNASGIDAVIEDSSYGKYLTSLNGTAAEGTSGWVYTVNGNEVMESIDTCVLSDGDTVQFEYISM